MGQQEEGGRMTPVERTPIKAPLACFGLEHSPLDRGCQACPHEKDCLKYMGKRANKTPLNELRFDLLSDEMDNLVPEQAGDSFPLALLRSIYAASYRTVFGNDPPLRDSVDCYRDEIVDNAHTADCPVAMFILSNMVAQLISEKTIIAEQAGIAKQAVCIERAILAGKDLTDDDVFLVEQVISSSAQKRHIGRFYAKLLVGQRAISRAIAYAKLCNDRYGSFSIYTLGVLNEEDYEAKDMEKGMLKSEVTAGLFLVDHTVHHSTPPLAALYAEKELELDPVWLATESSYVTAVLDPYLKTKTDSKRLNDHRLNVIKAIARFRRRRSTRAFALRIRQRILPLAVDSILSDSGVRSKDLLYHVNPVRDPLTLWIHTGQALQHYHCWLLLQGEPSWFAERKPKRIPDS